MASDAPIPPLEPTSVWTWRYADTEGRASTADVRGAASESPRFSSQADAESWVGEFWRDLLSGGVDAVTLEVDGRAVYGPMSLHPGTD